MRKKDKPTNLWNCGERLLRVEGHHIDTDISWRRKITMILAERHSSGPSHTDNAVCLGRSRRLNSTASFYKSQYQYSYRSYYAWVCAISSTS
jgi:hypothetical protein